MAAVRRTIRSTAGNRLEQLLADESGLDDVYKELFKEDAQDDEFAESDADEDVVDSDFDIDENQDDQQDQQQEGDASGSRGGRRDKKKRRRAGGDDDDEDEDDDDARKRLNKKKRAYVDPKAVGAKKAAGEDSAPASAAAAGATASVKKPTSRRRPPASGSASSSAVSLIAGAPPPWHAADAAQHAGKSLRHSTQQRTMTAQSNWLAAAERRKAQALKPKKEPERKLTQEELLEEAKITEQLNLESLDAFRRKEEEARKLVKKKPVVLTGQRIVFLSKQFTGATDPFMLHGHRLSNQRTSAFHAPFKPTPKPAIVAMPVKNVLSPVLVKQEDAQVPVVPKGALGISATPKQMVVDDVKSADVKDQPVIAGTSVVELANPMSALVNEDVKMEINEPEKEPVPNVADEPVPVKDAIEPVLVNESTELVVETESVKDPVPVKETDPVQEAMKLTVDEPAEVSDPMDVERPEQPNSAAVIDEPIALSEQVIAASEQMDIDQQPAPTPAPAAPSTASGALPEATPQVSNATSNATPSSVAEPVPAAPTAAIVVESVPTEPVLSGPTTASSSPSSIKGKVAPPLIKLPERSTRGKTKLYADGEYETDATGPLPPPPPPQPKPASAPRSASSSSTSPLSSRKPSSSGTSPLISVISSTPASSSGSSMPKATYLPSAHGANEQFSRNFVSFHGYDPQVLPRAITLTKIPYAPRINCVISGKPAKYLDPLTMMPYADAAAFKALRARYPSGVPSRQPSAGAASSSSGQSSSK